MGLRAPALRPPLAFRFELGRGLVDFARFLDALKLKFTALDADARVTLITAGLRLCAADMMLIVDIFGELAATLPARARIATTPPNASKSVATSRRHFTVQK